MCLLAVDLGMKAGLAWFGEDGRLLRCRTVHFPNRTVLKKAMPAILDELPLDCAVIEGGGPVAALWKKEIVKRDLPYIQTCAEAWREDILWLRERRNGPQAKEHALQLAMKVLRWSNVTLSSPLADDAAEAVLCGLWAERKFGIIEEFPNELRKP